MKKSCDQWCNGLPRDLNADMSLGANHNGFDFKGTFASSNFIYTIISG